MISNPQLDHQRLRLDIAELAVSWAKMDEDRGFTGSDPIDRMQTLWAWVEGADDPKEAARAAYWQREYARQATENTDISTHHTAGEG